MSPHASTQVAHDLRTALRILQMAAGGIAGEVKSPEQEVSFMRAIRREQVTAIGGYQVYMDLSREDRTTVFVHDPTPQECHKYIIARAASHMFVVAAPMSWTYLHRNILARVMAATGLTAHCSGGGFVSMVGNGRLEVDGASTDYGEGDHATAKAALTAAVKNSMTT